MLDNRLFLFVHVAKTGGTTIRQFLAQKLVPQKTFIHLGEPAFSQEKAARLLPFAERPVEERVDAKVICGHRVTCRTHLLVPGKTPHYIAFLREPAGRLISYYNFEMNRRSQKEQPAPGFDEWYETGRSNNITLGWLYREVFGEERPRHVNETVYKRVVRRLEEFWFVGCSEYLDRDFPLLLRFIGVSGTPERANVSGVNYPKLIEESDELRNRLNADNELDFKLYQHFRARLDKRVGELQALIEKPNQDFNEAKTAGWFRKLFTSAGSRSSIQPHCK
jgi:hypothetical protein